MRRYLSSLLALAMVLTIALTTAFAGALAMPMKSQAAPRMGIERRGIDVSRWQLDIDWKLVKESGVEFAMIKCAGRNEADGSLYEDPKFRENIKGAIAQGIRVGVYFFTQAITEEEAIEEANYTISRILPYKISMPVITDFEWHTDESRLKNSGNTKEDNTRIQMAFLNTIKSAGYQAGLYGDSWRLYRHIDAEAISKKHRIWIASYSDKPNEYYKGVYDLYQYTSNGSVPGINARVDLDIWYDDGTQEALDYSPIFDAEYYVERYPNLKTALGEDGAKLMTHFTRIGINEGRQASEEFNINYYYNRYRDLRLAFGNNKTAYVNHYLKYGKAEGRDAKTPCDYIGLNSKNGVNYAPVYDFLYYINNNPDVKRVYGNDEEKVLNHFINHGIKEGRVASPNFNVRIYKEKYADLQRAFGDNYVGYFSHYLKNGLKEGRTAKADD